MRARKDASYLRRQNSAAVLEVLLRTGGMHTITSLAKTSGVSRPTCEEALAELVPQGWVTESDAEDGPRQPGRPARRFHFRAAAGHVASIDIGAHKILALVADLAGQVVSSVRTTVTPELGAEARLAVAWQALTGALARTEGANSGSLMAVAVGTTGIVDENGAVLASSVLPGWTGLALRDRVARFVAGMVPEGHTVWTGVENDMRLAALAEHWRGAAQGVGDVVYLHAGYRMGTGVLIGGRPHRGRHGAAGEVGTLSLLNWDSSYARLLSGQQETHTPGDIIERVFTAAASGEDARAADLVASFARDLSHGLAAMVLSIDPELVVIGGGISRAGSVLVEPVTRHLGQECYFPPRVAVSELGDEGVALGALRLGLDQVEHVLFSPDTPLGAAPVPVVVRDGPVRT